MRGGQFVAEQAGHYGVGQQQVHGLAEVAGAAQRVIRSGDVDDVVSLPVQDPLDQPGQAVLVFRDEDGLAQAARRGLLIRLSPGDHLVGHRQQRGW